MSLSNNIRNNVYLLMREQLRGIVQADGYSTQPRICESWDEATNAQEACCLWVVLGSERFGEMEVSGRQTCAVEYQIYALVKKGHGDIQQEANALLQDVRNILSTNRAKINQETGAVFLGFDDCDTDEGQLSAAGRVVWVQPVVFTYIAGNSW